jgi:hypothetical protein
MKNRFINKLKLFAPAILFGIVLIFGVNALTAMAEDIVPTFLPTDSTTATMAGAGRLSCSELGTLIRKGDISLRDLPCFIKYFAQTLITIGGSLALIFVMIGGYTYVLGSDEDKEKAKKTITYALIGLAVSLLSWVIVDLALRLATE